MKKPNPYDYSGERGDRQYDKDLENYHNYLVKEIKQLKTERDELIAENMKLKASL